MKIDNKHLFLTYPKNDTTTEEAMTNLKEHFKDNLDSSIIAREQHQDGTNHLHIYIKTKKRFTTTKHDYFNFIANKQGNYQGCKNIKDVIAYITKYDDYITYNIDVPKYIQEVKSKKPITSKGIFLQITDDINHNNLNYNEINNKYPAMTLQHGKKIKEYIENKQKQSDDIEINNYYKHIYDNIEWLPFQK